MNWKDHLDNLTAEDVVSAGKALDYFDGYQIKHLENYLNETVKDWQARGVIPVVDNITQKIITRSALTYQQEPQRFIMTGETENETLTETYNKLLGYDGFVSVNTSDVVSRLLKCCLVLVQYVQETDSLSFSVLHRANCDVDFNLVTKEVESILYTAGGVGPNGNKVFHYWDKEQIIDLEADSGSARIMGQEDNPYKMIPVMVRYDISPPRVGFWPKPQWEEIITLNEVSNAFHTEVRHGARMQTFSPLFTNATIPDGTVIGPDAIVNLESMNDDIYLEYKTPDINLDKFRDWMLGLQEQIADNWGVNLSFGGGGSADSGFKLVVEETWNLEVRKQRLKSAKVAEEQLFTVIKSISEKHNLGLPNDCEFMIDFADPALAVDTISEREQDRADYAVGLLSKEDIIRKQNPDITQAELDEKLNTMTPPDFTDAVADS